jgi:hypothetical protein
MYKKTGFLLGLLGMVISMHGFAASVNKQDYKFNVHLPASWKIASNEKYTGGYVKVFVPQSARGRLNEQNIVINYTQQVKSSLNTSMQQVATVLAKADCSTRDVKVIDRGKNSINFVALLDKCRNGKSLTQVFKIFNTPNGQYAILYTANLHRVSHDVIKDMQKLVKTADIVRA